LNLARASGVVRKRISARAASALGLADDTLAT
jgi:hypothetical protein